MSFNTAELPKELRPRIVAVESMIELYDGLAQRQGCPLTFLQQAERDTFKDRLEGLKLFQLTEEKRRLLSAIIELSKLVVNYSFKDFACTSGDICYKMRPFFPLLEFKKRIDVALTIEELGIIDEELEVFKRQHPELTAT